MLDRAEIAVAHWQMRRTLGEAVLGDVAAGYGDLDQEIVQCILTPIRSVPLNPEKGCDLDQFRDRPTNIRYLLVAAEVRRALQLWCPRVVVHGTTVAPAIDGVTISVTWTPTESVSAELQTTEVAYV